MMTGLSTAGTSGGTPAGTNSSDSAGTPAGTISAVASNSLIPYIQLMACSAPTGADYAEIFTTRDGSLSPGELVALDPKNPRMVKRMKNSGQESLIGVVSTDPGYIVGDADSGNGEGGVYKRPIALKGRVPVKVSLENGPILIGDPIGSSLTKQGLGAKAIHRGQPVVGYAMQNFDGTVRRDDQNLVVDTAQEAIIEVFINLGWYHLDYTASSLPTGDAPNVNAFWKAFSVDPNNLFFKPSFGMDLEGNDITNIDSLTSASSTWSISKDGLLEIQEISSKGRVSIGTSEEPTGLVLYDLKGKNPYCVLSVDGQLKSFAGRCDKEQFPRILEEVVVINDSNSYRQHTELDSVISNGSLLAGPTNAWSVDQVSGKVNVNFFGDLNLNGNSILNVSKILGMDGKWKIDENGKIVVKEIETEKIITKELCVDDVCVTREQFKEVFGIPFGPSTNGSIPLTTGNESTMNIPITNDAVTATSTETTTASSTTATSTAP